MTLPSASTTQNAVHRSARELIAAYRDADYFVRLPGGDRVLVQVAEFLPAALRARLHTHETGAFITAWNPRSQPLSTNVNRRRQYDLLHALRDRAREVCVGVGCGADWREPSLCALGIDIITLDRLALHFEQNAVLTFRPQERVRLRLYRADWRVVMDEVDDLDFASAMLQPLQIR